MESKFTAYLLHKFLEQTDTNLVFPVSIRMRPSKKAYKTSTFETNLVNSYRIMFDFSCLLSERPRVRIAPGAPKATLYGWLFVSLSSDENAVRIHGAAVSPASFPTIVQSKRRRIAPGTPEKNTPSSRRGILF